MSKAKAQWFTPEANETMKQMMQDTWRYIGNDVMQALAEEGKYSMPRSHVIEVVLDADHLSYAANSADKKQILALFNQMTYQDRIKFAKTVFTFASYS